MADAGRVLSPEARPWLALTCHCYNPVGWHACHSRAESAAEFLGEPTARDGVLVTVLR